MNTEKIKALQTILNVTPDGIWGPKSGAALDAVLAPSPPDEIRVEGWSFIVRVDDGDLWVDNCRATCFGGGDDPQDSGETASGISTKDNPNLAAVSLPMDFGDRVPNTKGSPIPKIPWKTMVEVHGQGSLSGVIKIFPVIDIGPARRTGNAIDLTIAAARMFNPKATARNFEMRCSFRIIGGAKYLA